MLTRGDNPSLDDPLEPVSVTYTYSVRALGYAIHERIWMNDLFGEVRKFEQDLMDAARDDSETAGAAIFNNSFTDTGGFDGLSLINTAHTRLDGGATWANAPSTDEPLSVSALQNAIVTMSKTVNDRGRPRMIKPSKLLVPPDLMFTAREILRSTLLPGSANNDVNAIREFNLDLVEWNHLTSTTAWWLIGDKHDINFLWRFRAKTGMDTVFRTDTIERKVRQGYATGHGEARGIYGTDGVA